MFEFRTYFFLRLKNLPFSASVRIFERSNSKFKTANEFSVTSFFGIRTISSELEGGTRENRQMKNELC